MPQEAPLKITIGSEQGSMASNINMHVNLSWLKVEERLTSLLLVFVRRFDMLNVHSWTLMHTPQDMPQEVSSQYPSKEQTMRGTQYYIEP